MCGIAGFIGNRELSTRDIEKTLELMQNRGPDFQDFSEFNCNDQQVYLLHSRLSIIDLDPRSNQPFQFGHLHLTFNGEIYNFVEIREDLQKHGYNFSTSSDTEVLIKAYHFWGKSSFEKLEGMWALAIYDDRSKELVLSRDRFAEKPLFYLKSNEGIYFGSEVKFISRLMGQKPDINMNQVRRYLVNGYKSLYKHNETFYKDVKEVNYASLLSINSDLEIQFQTYWSPDPKIDSSLSLKDAIDGVREKLINSVKLRLRADVQLAFCLSGGIDSASLASIAAKEFNYDVSTFSIIDSDERYNEFDNIKSTIEDIGCDHTLIHLEPGNSIARLQKLVNYHDGPLATISYLVHSMLSEQIAANGYKVAISGTAADELLTGYYDHFNLHLYELKDHPRFEQYLGDWNEHLSGIVRNPYLKNPKLYFDNMDFRGHIYLNNDVFSKMLHEPFEENFTEELFTENLLHNRMLNELFHEGSRVILHEDDLNSMFYSIENRSPYLDSSLFEFSYSIPMQHLIKDGYAKYVLREAMDGILNDNVRLDRRKKGFNASISSLIDFKSEQDREFILDNSLVYDLVKKEKIEELFEWDTFPNSYSKFIFNLVNVKIFLEQHEQPI